MLYFDLPSHSSISVSIKGKTTPVSYCVNQFHLETFQFVCIKAQAPDASEMCNS